MNKFTLFTFLMVFSIFSTTVVAQELRKCGTDILLKQAMEKDPTIKQRMEDNEKMLQEFMQNALLPVDNDDVVTLPIVFHVIHNGEAVGTGNNIPDARILEQLARLNEDYGLTNADKLAPGDLFYPEQANTKIQFCLAQQDASGNPTTGITRYNGGQATYTAAYMDANVKPATIWDPTKYINFWIAFLDDPAMIDGYGTFPGEETATTSGVVVHKEAIGKYFETDKSITATHEIGHYLHLHHIWGDETCGDDLVADTPQHEKDNSTCPATDFTVPYNVGGCVPEATNPRGEMYMNYMDYTAAECIVMFSTGQKNRMRATLSTSRASLVNSVGCQVPATNEAEILAQSIKIYPNPSSDNFRIESNTILDKDVSITVYNQIGVAVRQYKNVNQFPFTIYTNGMPDGMYYATFGTQNQYASKKLLLVR